MQPSSSSKRRSRSKKSLNSNYFNQLRANRLPMLSSSPNMKRHQQHYITNTDNRLEHYLPQNNGNNNSHNHLSNDNTFGDEVNEQNIPRYIKKARPSQTKHSRRSGTLTILEDSEAYPRRSSQITHEPYWNAEKSDGVHPFQTPTYGNTEVHKFWDENMSDINVEVTTKPNLKNSASDNGGSAKFASNGFKKYYPQKQKQLHKRNRSQSLNARDKSPSAKKSINMMNNNSSSSISGLTNDAMYIPEEDVLNLDDVQQAKFHNSGHYESHYGNSSSDSSTNGDTDISVILPSVRVDDDDDDIVIVDNGDDDDEYSDDDIDPITDLLTTPPLAYPSPKQVSFVMSEPIAMVDGSDIIVHGDDINPKLTLTSSKSLLTMCTTSEVPDSIGAILTPCKISTDPEFQFPGAKMDGRKQIERFGKQISILKQARHSVISIAFLNDNSHQSLAVKNNTLNNTSMNVIPDDDYLNMSPAKLLRANSFSPSSIKNSRNSKNRNNKNKNRNSRNVSKDNSPHKKKIKGLFGFGGSHSNNGKSPMNFKRNHKTKYKKRHTTAIALANNRSKTPKASMFSSSKQKKQNLRNYNRALNSSAVRNGIQSDITKINTHFSAPVKDTRIQRASSDINCLKKNSSFDRIYPAGSTNLRNSPLPSMASMVPPLNNTHLQTRDIIHLIPMTVSNYIKDHELDPNKLPVRQDFETVAMFADVSGFTKLSEHLANSGPGGAEKLAFYLNRYLEQITAKVRKEGGDVFKFAGDAMIIIWLPDEDYSYFNAKKREQSRCEMIARAVQAARAIQKEFHNAEIIKGFVKLSIKIGIGYGETSLLFVGGQFGRVEYLISGTSVAQAFRCEGYATAGDVIISREAYEHVAEDYVYGSGMYFNPNEKHKKNKHVILLDDQLQQQPNKKRISNSDGLLHVVHEQKNSVPEVYKVNLSRKKYQKVRPKQLKTVGQRYLTQDRLRGFVPRAAWQRLSLRHKPWHGEQRAVTVLFINLDFGPANDLEHMDKRTIQLLQVAIKTTQQCIYRYKGSLNKFLFDDKGSNVVAVFGLPPIANFDDCTRGVLCALLIEQEIARIVVPQGSFKSDKSSFSSHSSGSVTSKSAVSNGNSNGTIDRNLLNMSRKMVRARIGVNTGRVYCGLVGAAGSASEYGILGDQVNLAARLMQHACKDVDDGGLGGSGVVVSNTTYEQAKECINIHWESLKSATVKGFSKEFRIWRPSYFQLRGEIPMKRNRFFIAWSEYMEILSMRLLELVKSDAPSSGHVIALEADHKGGSTHFARELLHTLQSHVYVVGTVNLPFNDQHDEHSPLFAWRALLSRIVRECRLFRANEAKFHASFARFLIDTGGSHLVKYLPVLNQLLDCKFAPEDPLVAEIVPDPFLNVHHARLVSYAPGLMEDQDINSTSVSSSAHIAHMKQRKTPTAHTPSNSNDLRRTSNSNMLPPLSQIDSENEYLSNKMLTEEEKQHLLLQWRVELIVHLLQQVCKYTPMVLIISKFQYMAVSDWEITDLIADKIFNHKLLDVSLVLSGWSMNTKAMSYLVSPQEKEIVKQYHKLRDKYVGIHFVLPKWTKQEVRDFLKHEFDINHTTKHVLQFIMNKTDGIPGMIKCLVHDQKLLFLKHGGHLDCSKIERCGDLNLGFKLSDINLPIPYSIQSYFTKMLDSLEQFCLLTIKTASVISVGQEYLSVSFAYDMIERVHPLRNENGFTLQLHHALNTLIKEKFICVLNTSHYNTANSRNEDTYSFEDEQNNFDESSNSNKADTNRTLFEGDIQQHNIYTFYHFTSGYLRDVTYGNMLYKQRSVLHKRLKEQLDEELQTRDDKIFRQCRNRHHILSLNDGFVHDKELIAQQKMQIIGNDREERHDLWWSFPYCVLILYIQAVTGIPDALEPFVYVSVHVGDDKGKHITSSMNCRNQYLTITLDEHIMNQIEDEFIGPVLTMRLWHKQNYRADQTIGKFTLRLRELYEKQLSEQMMAVQQRTDIAMGISLQLRSEHSYGTGGENMSDSGYDSSQRGSLLSDNKLNNFGSNSKRNSLNSSTTPYSDEYQDLFVGYKMTIHVKQKKIARFNIEEKLYLETFVRFCSVENDPGNTSNYV